MKLLLHIVPLAMEIIEVFGETYSRRRYAEMGIDVEFVQDNPLYRVLLEPCGYIFKACCCTGQVGTMQSWVIFDVAVDIRLGNPTYGQWEGYKLTRRTVTSSMFPLVLPMDL